MELNARRALEVMIGLCEVVFLGVEEGPDGELCVHIECIKRATFCEACGLKARLKERPVIGLVDMACFGRRTRLVWHKRRFSCPGCPRPSWTEEDHRIGAPRMAMTDRAARWATEQVGRHGRTVNEIAVELGCDWHTVNDIVVAYGTALVEHADRFGAVEALGLDEVLFARIGNWHRQEFSTQIVDVNTGQLLDVVPGRSGDKPKEWLEAKGKDWRDNVRWATLDLSGPYRAVFDDKLPGATQVADPFHVVKLANSKLDECRRRVQNETMGHRGHKSDPLYRCRRLLTKADERIDEKGKENLLGLLRAGDPKGEVKITWHAKEAVRELYTHTDATLALEWLERLAEDMADPDNPIEVRSLGRTLKRWKHQIVAWHAAHVTNGPTEAVNNLIKRVKRVAFGFRSFRNYRIRSLLYAGKSDWALLATIRPR